MLLSYQTVLDLSDAAVAAKLDRDALLGSVNRSIVSAIRTAATSGSQILADLQELNDIGCLDDGNCPLMVWLDTAIALAQARRQAGIFIRARDELLPKLPLRTVAPPSVRPEGATPSGRPDAPTSAYPITKDTVDHLEKLLRARERSAANDMHTALLTAQIDDIVTQIIRSCRRQPGDVVAGTELIKVIGSGNFGTIWLAKSIEDGSLLATKVFHLDKLTNSNMLWYFRRSIRALTRMKQERPRCPDVVQIHEVEENTLAFSMEYLPEGNLENIADRGWTLSKKIQALITICRAVEVAHHIGIIHRDIKPANIVLNSSHTPVLTDFDIADMKFLSRLSVAAGSLGTPVFAAPEQLEDATSADERADVYSLGRLLYFFLLERSPTVKIEGNPSLDNISHQPSTLVSIVRRATQFNPEQRYQTVAALRQALEAHQSRKEYLRARASDLGRWMAQHARALVSFVLILVLALTVAVMQSYIAVQTADAANRARREKELAEEHSRELRAIMSAVKSASDAYARLSDQKSRLRAEVSRLEDSIAAKEGNCRKLSATSSERSRCDKDLGGMKEDLDSRHREQESVDREVQRVKEQLADAQYRAEVLEKRNAVKCWCDDGDTACKTRCIAKN